MLVCVCKEGVACVSVFSPTDKGGASTSISVDYIKGGVASVPISLSEVGVASVPSVALKVRLFLAFCQSKLNSKEMGVAFGSVKLKMWSLQPPVSGEIGVAS